MRPTCPRFQSSCIVSTNLKRRFGEHKLKSTMSNVSSSSSSQQNLRNVKHLLTICCACRSLYSPHHYQLATKKSSWQCCLKDQKRQLPCFSAVESSAQWLRICCFDRHEANRFEHCLASRGSNSTNCVCSLRVFYSLFA